MSRWIHVKPLGEIKDMGLDSEQRQVYDCDVLVTKEPSATFEDEVETVLELAAIGVDGVDLFVASKAVIPQGDGPYVSILSTGGTAGLWTHNVTTGPTYRQQSVKVQARGANSAAARAKAEAARAALLAVKNQDVAA